MRFRAQVEAFRRGELSDGFAVATIVLLYLLLWVEGAFLTVSGWLPRPW